MEDEIKVGEWVKLDNENIGQVIAVEKGSIMLDIVQNRWVGMCCIKKHSSNIIDLIEVKDVIHYRIDHISTTLETKGYIEGVTEITDEEMLQSIKENPDYHILEILTKEQWNQTAYTIHEREEKENE